MAFNIADRVRESSTTSGTGSIALGGASAGYISFAAGMAVGDTTWYCITGSGGSEFEVGLGTLSASTTLDRTTVFSSSNANAKVTFSAGTKDVFVTTPSQVLELLGTLATPAEIISDTALRLILVTALWDAFIPTAWGTISGTYAPNMNTFINATATISASLTLDVPTNIKAGQAGEILFTMGAASLTISYASVWKSVGATPTAPTTSGALCLLSYRVFSSTLIIFSLSTIGA